MGGAKPNHHQTSAAASQVVPMPICVGGGCCVSLGAVAPCRFDPWGQEPQKGGGWKWPLKITESNPPPSKQQHLQQPTESNSRWGLKSLQKRRATADGERRRGGGWHGATPWADPDPRAAGGMFAKVGCTGDRCLCPPPSLLS